MLQFRQIRKHPYEFGDLGVLSTQKGAVFSARRMRNSRAFQDDTQEPLDLFATDRDLDPLALSGVAREGGHPLGGSSRDSADSITSSELRLFFERGGGFQHPDGYWCSDREELKRVLLYRRRSSLDTTYGFRFRPVQDGIK